MADTTTIDESKKRIYAFLIEMGRWTIDDVPEPYKTALTPAEGA